MMICADCSEGQPYIVLIRCGKPGKRIQLGTLLAGWRTYVESHFAPSGVAPPSWEQYQMPVLHHKDNYDPDRMGFDSLLRDLSGACRNTKQAELAFFENANNRQWISRIDRSDPAQPKNPRTGRPAAVVKLTQAAVDYWAKLSSADQQHSQERADALMDSDITDEPNSSDSGGADTRSAMAVVSLGHGGCVCGQAKANLILSGNLLQDLVELIHTQPYTPCYRNRPIAGVVHQGWPARLAGYFWPNPLSGLAAVTAVLAPIVARLNALMLPVVNAMRADHKGCPKITLVWPSDQMQRDAVAVANDIFRWGGVPQTNVTAQNVYNAICNALVGNYRCQAPMNSGWTKLAAFAVECAQAQGFPIGTPQAIWDSRVSTSIAWRIHEIMEVPGSPCALNNNLRVVSGRGGCRPLRQTILRQAGWDMDWGTAAWNSPLREQQAWGTHFAGGILVAGIRDILNANLNYYGFPGVPASMWTMRDVEMVLFMDGY